MGYQMKALDEISSDKQELSWLALPFRSYTPSKFEKSLESLIWAYYFFGWKYVMWGTKLKLSMSYVEKK